MSILENWPHGIIVFRILIATICGALIGSERTSRNKGAGLRTHAILSLGACLIMCLSKYGFTDLAINGDPARLAAQIVSGIGFLGAGVIYVRHGSVSGLTTAAGIWTTSAIGMCIGAGLYDVGILATCMILFIQMLFHKGKIVKMAHSSIMIQIETKNQKELLQDLQSVFDSMDVQIQDYKIVKTQSDSILFEFEGLAPRKFNKETLFSKILDKDYVISLES